jgi:hypothetical protein
VLIVPEDKLDVDTLSAAGGGGAMAIESLTDWVCTGLPPSLTVTVTLLVPLALGVPEISPVAEARLRPAGRLPAVTDHL